MVRSSFVYSMLTLIGTIISENYVDTLFTHQGEHSAPSHDFLIIFSGGCTYGPINLIVYFSSHI